MILVIFGAGASYDSIPHMPPSTHPRSQYPDRPPLANELFLDSGIFAKELSRYQVCAPIIPYLRGLRNEQTIENALEALRSEADKDPKRSCQLAAVQFYLHNMIWACEDAWNGIARGITNYRTLVDQLRRVRDPAEPVCLVTFNYDRLLDRALADEGIVLDGLPKYIASDTFKLFKLHGSVDWWREVDTPIANIQDRKIAAIEEELIQRAADLDISQRYRVLGNRPTGRLPGVALYPAIAIPVETKRSFECPNDHLVSLQQHLARVTKVLIIGWRGTEEHFLCLLREGLKQPISLCVVDKDETSATDVETKIRLLGHPIVGGVKNGESGFSDFLKERGAEKALHP